LSESRRILAIDFGERRVGIAVSDPTNLIAQGLPTLDNDPTLFSRLRSVVSKYHIGRIVVGMPYTLKGEMGPKAQEVLEFVSRLRKEVTVEVCTWDERFTSSLARDAIRQMGTKQMARRKKEKVDQMAATLLLQSYLDSLPREKRP